MSPAAQKPRGEHRWPTIEPPHAPRIRFLKLVGQIVVAVFLLGWALVARSWIEGLLLAMFLPAVTISLVLGCRRQTRGGFVAIDADSFADHSLRTPQRIEFTAVTEVREFASALEVVHESLSLPCLWRLPSEFLAPDAWAEFTLSLKERVREVNPHAAIYDASTGPPPA